MVDEDYQLSEIQEEILSVMQIGRKDGEPWGRVTPRYLVDVMGVERQNLHYHLKELVRVGYLEKPVDGLYELVDDP